jgi:predicted flap endonuclease-1-like 5' DNA nuclease
MTYLIAKFSVIFLLAAALSFVLGHWWARRRFVDVTRSFESMWAARDQDAAPQPNLSAQLDEISELLKRPGSARAGRSTSGSPGKVDLSAVQNRLSSIEQKIEGIRIPQPREIDIDDLLARIDRVDQRLTNLRIPEPPVITPLESRMDQIGQQIARLGQGGGVASDKGIDFSPLLSRLSDLETTMNNMVISTGIDEALENDEMLARLDGIEQRLERLAARLADDARHANVNQVVSDIEKLATPSDGDDGDDADRPATLEYASTGEPDDLTRIDGVNRRQAKLLNANGIYYFWQIAEWSGAHADWMNQRLAHKDARIQKEKWVAQAGRLAGQPDASSRPAR